jgi:protein SCO1/2
MAQLFRTRQRVSVIAAVVFTILAAVASFGQTPAAKKSYTFKGKVEGVKVSAGKLTVNGEKVSGWMDAMTMDYKVEDPGMLKTVSVGDEISATVYDGDMTLHQVKVISKKPAQGKGAGDAKPK